MSGRGPTHIICILIFIVNKHVGGSGFGRTIGREEVHPSQTIKQTSITQ